VPDPTPLVTRDLLTKRGTEIGNVLNEIYADTGFRDYFAALATLRDRIVEQARADERAKLVAPKSDADAIAVVREACCSPHASDDEVRAGWTYTLRAVRLAFQRRADQSARVAELERRNTALDRDLNDVVEAKMKVESRIVELERERDCWRVQFNAMSDVARSNEAAPVTSATTRALYIVNLARAYLALDAEKQAPQTLFCVWCGANLPWNPANGEAIEILREHSATCAEHPAVKQLAALSGAGTRDGEKDFADLLNALGFDSSHRNAMGYVLDQARAMRSAVDKFLAAPSGTATRTEPPKCESCDEPLVSVVDVMQKRCPSCRERSRG
jgi:hypothetical protein